MKLNQLDHIIKEKLKALQVPYQPEHWDQFAQQLEIEDDPLSKTVKTKLEKLEAPYNPQHWEQLAENLESEDNPENTILKAKLENLSIPFNPKHWEMMEEKMDNEVGGPALLPTQDFDTLVYNKVHNYAASENQKQNQWKLLEQNLTQNAVRKEQLLQLKLIEATLIALLFLLIIRLPYPGATFEENIDKPEELRASSNLPIAEVEGAESTQLEASPNGVTQASLENQSSFEISKQEETIQPYSSIQKTDHGALLIREPSLTNKAEAELLLGAQDKASNEVVALLPSLELLIPEKELPPGILANEAPNSINRAEIMEILEIHSEINASFSQLSLPYLSAPELAFSPKKNIQISMLGGPDYYKVMTPENLSKGISAFDRYAIGYRGGFLIDHGKKEGRFRYGSGFIYVAKQYQARFQSIQGNFLSRGGLTAESLEDVELNLLNVPIFGRFEFLKKNRWSIFAEAGFSLQMALQANYYIGFPSQLARPIGINQTPSSSSSLSDRPGGLLEGGSFSENSFFTGNMGLGFQRSMTDRWSLFFQSRYEHSMGYFSAGLGPTQDRINTLSAEMGIRVNLK